MNKKSWTDDQLIKSVESCRSIRGVLLSICLTPAGGSYANIERHIRRLGLSTTHFTGQGWSKGSIRRGKYKKSLAEELVEFNDRASANDIRKRLIKEGLKPSCCEKCGISEWLGERAPLELDHINRVKEDYRIENLQILCANCHSIKTRIDRARTKVGRSPKSNERHVCQKCSGKKSRYSSLCRKCSDLTVQKKSKIVWPSIELLLEAKSARKLKPLAVSLGVSDNAIRHHIERYHLGRPTTFPLTNTLPPSNLKR